jgi:pimeloyl-ACP methyl ester carboxylesterase
LWLFLLTLAVVAFAVLISVPYRRDMQTARERLEQGGSKLAETACGPIEYATAGTGPPVLVIHGAGGGWNQGILLGQLLVGDRFHIIAPSRFGFLRTPIPADSSIEAQADLYGCLLDKLKIERLPVVGFSAGGPSSAFFAARHRARTSALVLVSAISDPGAPGSRLAEIVTGAFLRSDFVYWLLLRFARPTLIAALGLSTEVQARLSPEQRARIFEVLDLMNPISMRSAGTLLDEDRFVGLVVPLEEVTAPTLVTHALDDTLVTIQHGQHSAARIRGARLITLPDGGHFSIGHHAELRERITSFLVSGSETFRTNPPQPKRECG